MVTYLRNDKKLDTDTATTFPVVVAGADLTGDPEVIRVFKTNTEFSKWSDRTAHGDQVRDVLRTVRDKVLPEQRNEKWVEQVQRVALKRSDGNFRAFAKILDRDPLDEEVIRLSMVDRTPLTPNIFDPALLYDRIIEREPPMGAPKIRGQTYVSFQAVSGPIWVGRDGMIAL